ncbi:MAG: DUF2339 domain-containing protein [Bryobacterales bacterium]|nr:DUF2339 domain-containing protein [Bryobacterales bacterium]
MEWIALIAVLILWRAHASKTRNLNTRIEEQDRILQQLTRRVFELEHGRPAAARMEPAEAEPAVVPVAALTPLEQPWIPEPAVSHEPAPLPAPEMEHEPEPVAPGPSFEDRIRERMKGVDWEAMIGGSWLNAVGVLILVVGIALFLGYALTQFGPAGKVSIGIGVSLCMLAAGVAIERKPVYAIFGRGLLAGGWASLYFTTYAMHALPAARVVESPLAGGALLLAVACGMIAHSLGYRSQRLTLLAYLTAFFALQIGPMTWLSIVACIPLSVSLLTISRKLEWTNIPVFGLILTYFTFAFRYRPQELTPFYGSAALFTYWLAFEVHDLLKLRAAARRSLTEMTLFPLNGFLLIGTAMMTLPKSTPVQSSYFLATAGVIFLVSTILRMRWKAVIMPPANTLERILADSHRIAVSFASALFAGALIRRFPTDRSAIGLMMEAQLLVLAGLRSGDRFFCHAGAAVFAIPVMLIIGNSGQFGQLQIGAHKFGGWVPYAAFLALQYYFNRWLTRGGAYYTWGALGLLLASSGALLSNHWTGAAWIAIGVALIEGHRRTGWSELLLQAAIACAFGFEEAAVAADWPVAAAGALLLSVGALRLKDLHRDAMCALAAALAAVAMWRGLPAPLVAMGWGMLALLAMELGHSHTRRWIVLQGHVLSAAAFARVFAANYPVFSDTAGVSHRLLTVLPVIALAWHGHRRSEPREGRFYSWAGVLMLGALIRFELGRDFAVLGWALLMLALIHAGRAFEDRDYLWQGYALAALAFARGWATNFSGSVAMAAGVIACFHLAQFRLRREHRYGRPALALMGAALLSILLYYEISGSVLTIALGAQAVGLLVAGFAAQERVFRLAGLSLFGICVLKLFFYDLRNLETLSRILSFIVLGLVLMAASWLYMRFKDKIQRYL